MGRGGGAGRPHGVRTLRRTPGFTLVVILILALGIGANTAVSSLINTLMLRRLPIREPGQLVELVTRVPGRESVLLVSLNPAGSRYDAARLSRLLLRGAADRRDRRADGARCQQPRRHPDGPGTRARSGRSGPCDRGTGRRPGHAR